MTARGVIVLAGVSLATAALALAPGSATLLIALGMVLGLMRGIYTLIQATAVTDRWGPSSYGRLNGILTAPALAAAAVAPFAGAALAELLGSYSDAFLVLAGLAAVAAVLMLGTDPARERVRRMISISVKIDRCRTQQPSRRRTPLTYPCSTTPRLLHATGLASRSAPRPPHRWSRCSRPSPTPPGSA